MKRFKGRQIDEVLSEPDDAVRAAVEAINDDVLVLGAGGKMGLHLSMMVQRALKDLGRKHRVKAVSRFGRQEQRAEFESVGIDIIPCDLSDAGQLERLPDLGSVFFMAGVKFGTSDSPELLHRMNVEMPMQVAEKFHKSSIVAYSTGCVYSFTDCDSAGSDEESETNPVGDYAQSCLGREQAFVQVSKSLGTRCALIRLNYSVEFRYGVLVDIAQKVMAGIPVDVSTGHVNVIWQRDAVAYSICALGDVASPPYILNVTGAENLSVRDVAAEFGRRFDKPAEIIGDEASKVWLNNAAKCHRMYGPPSVSTNEMINRIVEWLNQGGETLGKPTHFESRDGKF